MVARGPIEDLICFDRAEALAAGMVLVDFDFFAKFEEFLFDVENRLTASICDENLRRECEDFEAKRERILHAWIIVGGIGHEQQNENLCFQKIAGLPWGRG